jgi:nucleotide-binding universal stress UspA family protein
MHKRILVPLDGSDFSEAVLPHAQSLAQALDAEIVLLHVIVEPAPEFALPTSPLSPPIEVKKEKEKSREYIKAVCYKLEQEGLRVTYLIREGAVAETILDAAEVMQADMIAMSTHGRTGLLHLLLGSAAEQVVQKSPILVSLIRPQAR